MYCVLGYNHADVHNRYSHYTKEEEDEVAENLQDMYDQEGYRVTTRSARGISSFMGNENSIIDGRFSSSFSANDDDFVSIEVCQKKDEVFLFPLSVKCVASVSPGAMHCCCSECGMYGTHACVVLETRCEVSGIKLNLCLLTLLTIVLF